MRGIFPGDTGDLILVDATADFAVVSVTARIVEENGVVEKFLILNS